LIYSGILATLCIALVTSLAMTKPVILDVIRDRNTLYRDVGRRGIQNNYTLRIVNKHNVAHDYALTVSGIDGIEIESESQFSVAGESVFSMPVSVVAPHESSRGGHVIEFQLSSLDDNNIVVVEESRFRGPTEDY
jgi:polyferredoxin